ncbi:MAG: hypothetical protein PUC82_01280 [bacterium]|nr:hypothetical protein [bacterium]
MINEMTYDEILAASNDMKKSCQVITRLIQNRNLPDLENFVESVDNYTKYLDSTIELMVAADKALKGLIDLKK